MAFRVLNTSPQVISAAPRPQPVNSAAAVQPAAAAPAVGPTPKEPKDRLQNASGASPSALGKVSLNNSCEMPRRNVYINGILTPQNSAEKATTKLMEKTGEWIDLLYNPTEGIIDDAAEAIQNLSSVDNAVTNEITDNLCDTLNQEQPLRIFCHSQGSAIASHALRKVEKQWASEGVPPKDIEARMKNIEVVSFGGFATETSFPKGVQVKLFRNEKDFIPKFAQSLQAVGKAFKSNEADMLSSILNVGKTVKDFVAINAKQAVDHTVGRLTTATKGDVIGSIKSAVESDHAVDVDDEYTRTRITSGYFDLYEEQYVT